MSVFELTNEVAGYRGETVLSGVTLRVADQERIALVGESGVGKSTLLRLIYAQCQDRASLIPQEFGLVQSLTVFHNVYMGQLHEHSLWRNLRNLLRPSARDVSAVRDVVDGLRLDDKLFTTVGELSGGQQQRTAVGRALFHTGDIVLGDEPVSNVDEHQARRILDILGERKKTCILAMHDRALALDFADRLIGLKDGRIVLDEPTAGMSPSDLDPLYFA
ncbi:MAG: ATP-binding cassette domain-containing protein [Rhodospirillaceae bacterium]|jgi:phosphonate transport system ATP-binding protein|nr:ATP-binding cassette domain-containing protein [Rhodospirillaceae bacterium]MBT5666578.1 ATP-binding cassette domain-containing protein [Rhodospirillaceae bacterium]MBT5809234.1 ATP-binding cassette domain-containing protein [Rhodospirillaceae bacterium]